jgi:steroid 5-alpha reductase family enzyme
MIKTATILFASILAIPALAIYMADPLTPLQQAAITTTVYTYLGVSLACFVLSELTKNYSQVDKVWSIIPVVYAWQMAAISGFSERTILLASLVSLWGFRLTLNFARKGGYSWKFWEGEEDYRWSILREKLNFKHGWLWSAFNLLFISLYQNGLIMLITYPMLFTLEDSSPIGVGEIMVGTLMLLFIVYETVADNQQWNFHLDKHAYLKQTGDHGSSFEGGFNKRGLWSFSRHPNYFAEQSIWVTFYLFSVISSGQWLNWTVVGPVLLIMLFRGSSDFSEDISAKKYPSYTTYQEQVPRFIPNIGSLIGQRKPNWR